MNMAQDQARTKADKIEQLRRRLAKVDYTSVPHELIDVIKGLLDLLDEP